MGATVTECKVVSPTYFTCTLGQAAAFNSKSPHEFDTINEFVKLQAERYPKVPAVGFAIPVEGDQEWLYEVIDFETLYRKSGIAADALYARTKEYEIAGKQSCVALLSPSTPDFLFAWLGLMYLGYSVLLIAPQCQPEAIAHLCKSCDASVIFYEKSYSDLAERSTSTSLAAEPLPWQKEGDSEFQKPGGTTKSASASSEYVKNTVPTSQSVAYIHHTSGTSTGLPKPIPQTNRAGVGVLPCLDGSKTASFTTTPLYHGGVADCFRAWTSKALMWLFPGNVPITSTNIKRALDVTKRAECHGVSCPTVKYFSSVPYILQMLAEDEEGLNWLKNMDMVGVGGAALPDSVGAELSSVGVHLISRFGSAECGFLLSSHRDFDADQAWQYLRVPPGQSLLKFEPQGDGSGLSELVISKGWPHMAKTNREDGSFATSDLFQSHPDIEHAWRYHSRSDSQITLVTGKKFDPAPVEDAIAASEAVIRDVMVFGSGKQVPGALIFVAESAKDMADNELRSRISSAVEAVNRKGQDHTRISQDMIVVMKEGTLEKSSKGTILRRPAEETYSKQIEEAYSGDDADTGPAVALGDIDQVVIQIVEQVVGKEMNIDADFYKHGVDSAKATRIRTLLSKRFGRNGSPLPFNVIYDCGNVERLIQFLRSRQQGDESSEIDPSTEMHELVKRFSTFPSIQRPSLANAQRKGGRVLLLTGATGSLGAHLLSLVLAESTVEKVYCLVRSTSDGEAHMRIVKSLKDRQLEAVGNLHKVHCLACNLEDSNLGLSQHQLQELKDSTTGIIHTAWPVNFSLGLQSFVPSLSGLHNLITFSRGTRNPNTFVFCSSTASVLGPNHPSVIPETVSTTPSDSDSLGYSKSKWVAEGICQRASEITQDGSQIKILRIGQLTGSTRTGVWNMSEAYPLMLSTVKELKCLPDIKDELSWLAVDQAARAVYEIACNRRGATLQNGHKLEHDMENLVFHLVNDTPPPSFAHLYKWLMAAGVDEFDIVEPRVWLEKLEKLEEHPAKALLGLWSRAYKVEAKGTGKEQRQEGVKFDTARARQESEVMRNITPVDEKLVLKIWNWLVNKI